MLQADVFSLQFDAASDRVSAAWRVRIDNDMLALTLAGEQFRSLSMLRETIFVADEGGVPDDLSAIEWRPVPAPDPEDTEESTD